jgi:hypothetical protein
MRLIAATLIVGAASSLFAAAPYEFGDTISASAVTTTIDIDGKSFQVKLFLTRTVLKCPPSRYSAGGRDYYAWDEGVYISADPIDLGYSNSVSPSPYSAGDEIKTSTIKKNLRFDGEDLVATLTLKRVVASEPGCMYYASQAKELWAWTEAVLISGFTDMGTFVFLPNLQDGGGSVARVLSQSAEPSRLLTGGQELASLPSASELKTVRTLVKRTYARRAFSGTKTVDAGSYVSLPIVVDSDMRNPRMEGEFYACGGSGNDIVVHVMSQIDYVNWQNGHSTGDLYLSGQVTAGKLSTALPEPGRYWLVFSNRFSTFSSKEVQSGIRLKFEM